MKTRMRSQHRRAKTGQKMTGRTKKGAKEMKMGTEDEVVLENIPENQGASLP